MFSSEEFSELSDLPGKTVLFYNAKVSVKMDVAVYWSEVLGDHEINTCLQS